MKKHPEESVKKNKIPWWAKTLIIILAAMIIFVGYAYGRINYYLGDSLGIKGILAMTSYGGFNFPEGFRNFVLDVDRSYPGLPELLVAEDGSPVTTPEEFDVRREEMLDLYAACMYGEIPTENYDTSFTVVESGEALNGAALRQQVRITVSNEYGSTDAMLLIYTPANSESYGMFIGLNFSGNTAVWDDEHILPSVNQSEDVVRGAESSAWPVDQIIASGYGVASMYYCDWAVDNMEEYKDDVLRLFPETEMAACSGWAFGLIRGIDYLEQMENVNQDAITTVGHSRLGTTSLWAGANDTRVDLVTGSCCSTLMRSPIQAKINSSNSSTYSYTNEHFAYEGRDNEIPVDTHMLVAIIAGRNVYISCGNQDLASDPPGNYDTLQYAKHVWDDIYGIEVIPDGTYEELDPGVPVFSEGVAFHVHEGGHVIMAEDWQYYIQYMEEYVLN